MPPSLNLSVSHATYIQVVRNPFDAIASFACMLTPGGDNIKRSQQTWSIANISGFKEAHASFFANQQSVLDMLHDPALPNITIHHVHMASLVHSPSQEMTRLCDYLGLTCFPSYIRACEGTIHSRLSMTRKVIQWTPEIKESIEKRMKHFPWFQGYNFTSSWSMCCIYLPPSSLILTWPPLHEAFIDQQFVYIHLNSQWILIVVQYTYVYISHYHGNQVISGVW